MPLRGSRAAGTGTGTHRPQRARRQMCPGKGRRTRPLPAAPLVFAPLARLGRLLAARRCSKLLTANFEPRRNADSSEGESRTSGRQTGPALEGLQIPMNDVLSQPIGWVRERWPDAVTLLALALLCWVLARWTWVLLAPAAPVVVPAAPAPVDIQAALDEILRARLFSSQTASEAPIASTARRDVQLAGVFATAPRGRGWAVLQLEGKAQQVAASGTEIAPGLLLDQVFGDHVVVTRQ